MSAAGADDGARRVDPHVQVVRGAPDDVELAALVAGLAAAAAGRTPLEPDTDAYAHAARARWTTPAGRRRAALPAPGPTVWRWSLHP